MRSQTLKARLGVALATLALLTGCAAGTPSSPSAAAPSAPAGLSASPPPPPSASPSPSPSPQSTSKSTDSPSPKPTASLVGTVVKTLADDGLRVRSKPRIGDDSYKAEPLLPLGTQLYVLDGPVSASGYDWYEVYPLASRSLPSGWIASASRDGEPWVEPGEFDCPAVPTNFRSLAELPLIAGFACFPRVPITVVARLVSCNCDMDGGWSTPSWFGIGGGSPDLLVQRSLTAAPDHTTDWFILHLDPDGEHPDELPVGQVVEVTGMFDHPAAANCTQTEMDGEPLPSQSCRLEFAVTSLLVKGP